MRLVINISILIFQSISGLFWSLINRLGSTFWIVRCSLIFFLKKCQFVINRYIHTKNNFFVRATNSCLKLIRGYSHQLNAGSDQTKKSERKRESLHVITAYSPVPNIGDILSHSINDRCFDVANIETAIHCQICEKGIEQQ